jgi:hypothetical protein
MKPTRYRAAPTVQLHVYRVECPTRPVGLVGALSTIEHPETIGLTPLHSSGSPYLLSDELAGIARLDADVDVRTRNAGSSWDQRSMAM